MLGTFSGRPSWAFTLFGMRKWHHRKDSKKSQYLSCEIIFMKSYLWKAYLFFYLSKTLIVEIFLFSKIFCNCLYT